MAHLNLESKEIRARLRPRAHPYFKSSERGLHIGYRKNQTGGVWCVRFRSGSKYLMKTIGNADDNQPADNEAILSYPQARRKADGLVDHLKELIEEKQAIDAQRELERASRAYTVADACEDYLDWFKINRKTYEGTKQVIDRHIIPKLGDKLTSAITTKEINRWLRQLAQTPPRTPKGMPKPPFSIKEFTGKYTKPKGHRIYKYRALKYAEWSDEMRRKRKSSANRILTVLKAALNHSWKEGDTKERSEWARVKPYENADAPRVSYLDKKQAQKLLKACSDDFRPMARAALLTGCRYGELCNLLVDDFKTDHVHIRISKTGKMRDVPLSAVGTEFFKALAKGKDGKDYLITHIDGSEWGRSHQTRPMCEACQKAKIEPAISFHILRHTYATLLLSSKGGRGMSIRDVAALIGDNVSTCEKHYGHVIQDALKKEVARKLPNFGGGL